MEPNALREGDLIEDQAGLGVGNGLNQFWSTTPLIGLMVLIAGSLGAAKAALPSTNSITDLSLEDLVNVKVTSVQHEEFSNYNTSLRTEVSRSVLAKTTWRF